MLPTSELNNMNVLLATPCYISAVSMNYVTSIYSFAHEAERIGLKTALHMRAESLVTRARNMIVKYFLTHPQFTHLFWIDSDIEFGPSSALRLLLSDHDVVAGIYPIKRFNWPEAGLPAGMTQKEFEINFTDYPFNVEQSDRAALRERMTADGFAEVVEAPTGFMVIKRRVFEELMKAYPELNYVPDGPPNNPEQRYYWSFFDCITDPDSRRYLSEDYAFCRRWRDIGGAVHADLYSQLGHLGQHLWQGPLARSLGLI